MYAKAEQVLQDRDMRPVAMLLHYTCHPVNVFGHAETYHAISADWPGAWSGAMLEYSLGGTTGSVPLGGPAFRDFPEHAPIGLTVTRNGGTIGLSIATPLDGPLVKSHTFTGAQAAALDTLRFAGTMTYFSGFDYDNLQLVSGPLISATGTPAARNAAFAAAFFSSASGPPKKMR